MLRILTPKKAIENDSEYQALKNRIAKKRSDIARNERAERAKNYTNIDNLLKNETLWQVTHCKGPKLRLFKISTLEPLDVINNTIEIPKKIK